MFRIQKNLVNPVGEVPPQAAKFMMEESRQDIQRYAFEEQARIM